MKQPLYTVGGHKRRFTFDAAKAKAQEVFERTGVIVSLEACRPKSNPKPKSKED